MGTELVNRGDRKPFSGDAYIALKASNALHYMTSQHMTRRGITLYHTALYYSTLHHIVLYNIALH